MRNTVVRMDDWTRDGRWRLPGHVTAGAEPRGASGQSSRAHIQQRMLTVADTHKKSRKSRLEESAMYLCKKTPRSLTGWHAGGAR